MRKLTLEFVKEQFEKEGYKLLDDTHYISAHSKLSYVCPCGHIHNISWTNWQQGQRCFYCVLKKNSYSLRLELEFIKEEFKKENYILLTSKYYNSRQRLKYTCPNDHIGTIKWDHWKSGSRCRKCANHDISNRYKDSGNPNWNGGTSCEPYCFEWSSKEFKDFIKERDGYKCLNPDCWKTSKRLTIHHIDYNKKNCELGNLITLCNSCNSRANKNRKWHRSWYKTIIWMRYLKGKGERYHVNFTEWKS